MSSSNPTAVRTADTRGWWASGGWYIPVTILSLGLAAWVPFLHAATVTHRRRLGWIAFGYAAVAVALLVCASVAPAGAAGDTLATVAGLGGLLLIIVACVHQIAVRREVRGGVSDTERAVASVLGARERRVAARELAVSDPLLARELHIGRPDLPHTYDDGGLVDLNSAPAAAIASTCDIDIRTAEQIVSARDRQGCGFAGVDEVLVLVDVPVTAWDRIKDRAATLPV